MDEARVASLDGAIEMPKRLVHLSRFTIQQGELERRGGMRLLERPTNAVLHDRRPAAGRIRRRTRVCVGVAMRNDAQLRLRTAGKRKTGMCRRVRGIQIDRRLERRDSFGDGGDNRFPGFQEPEPREPEPGNPNLGNPNPMELRGTWNPWNPPATRIGARSQG